MVIVSGESRRIAKQPRPSRKETQDRVFLRPLPGREDPYGFGELDSQNQLRNNGKLESVSSWIGTAQQWTQKFTYDSFGRLREAKETKGDTSTVSYKQVFDYARFGNLFRKSTSNPTGGQENPLPYTAIETGDIDPAKNRFTSASGTAYNDNGQVVTDGKFRNLGYGYDANGRMIRTSEANKPDAISVYDALGNRVAQKVNDVWQFVIYDAFGKLLAEYGGNAQPDEGGVKYYLQDWQGSVRAGVNAGGFAKSRTDHQAFGEDIPSGVGLRTTAQGFGAPQANRQGYGLTEKDATGLNHTWFRKNENRAGRWTSPDPYNGSASVGNPQSWNRYSYVESQPTNFIDPSGLNASGGFYVCYDVVTYGGYEDGSGGSYAHTETVCIVFGGGIPSAATSEGSESGGNVETGGQIKPKQCGVAPLTQITDPIAKNMEDKLDARVNLDGLTTKTRNALRCLQEKVVPGLKAAPPNIPIRSGSGDQRGFKVESAFRPEAYQTHLYDIFSKSMQLRDRKKYGKECDPLRAQISAEKANHGLWGIVAKTNSRHASGEGFDMSITGASQSQITSWASECGLGRLSGIPGEETHFYLN